MTAILRAHEAADARRRSNASSSEPGRQAIVCALLARRFPAMRKDYLAAAARYNVRRLPPYQLVKLAIEAPTPAKSPTTATK